MKRNEDVIFVMADVSNEPFGPGEFEKIISGGLQAANYYAQEFAAGGFLLKSMLLFQHISVRAPDVAESFINTAIMQKRMKREDDALETLRRGLGRHPEHEQIVSGMVELLQHRARDLHGKLRVKDAVDVYREIVRIAPEAIWLDACLNLVQLYDALAMYKPAKALCDQALAKYPGNVRVMNCLCKCIVSEMQRQTVRDEAQKLFAMAKTLLFAILETNPEDCEAICNLATLHMESLQFPESIELFRKALAMSPDSLFIKSQLSGALARNGQNEEACELARENVRITDDPLAHYNLATLLSRFDRSSEEGKRARIVAMEKAVSVMPTKRTLCLDWALAKDVRVVVMHEPREGYFGVALPQSLTPLTEEIPLLFIDKQTVMLEIRNVYVEGIEGIMYTKTEVYAPTGSNTNIPRDYKDCASKTVVIDEPVLSLVHPSIANYYHSLVEVISRLVVSLEYFRRSGGVPENLRLLLPGPSRAALVHKMIDGLGLGLSTTPVLYETGAEIRYRCKRLFRADYVQRNTQDPEQADMWSSYLPSLQGMFAVRDLARQLRQPSARRYGRVVYVHRKGIRGMETGDDLLTGAMRELLGDELHVFGANNTEPATMQEQMDVFGAAEIVIGPHGAGLANILFCKPSAAVIEFPMEPHCNRCFGYMSVGLGLDYWVVPELTCFYNLWYHVDERKAQAVVDTLRHVARLKGILT